MIIQGTELQRNKIKVWIMTTQQIPARLKPIRDGWTPVPQPPNTPGAPR